MFSPLGQNDEFPIRLDGVAGEFDDVRAHTAILGGLLERHRHARELPSPSGDGPHVRGARS